MDLYVLNNNLRRSAIIDQYNSLIWTERFNQKGDVELHLNSTPENRGLFKDGIRLSIPGSKRIMVVESVQDKDGDDGKRLLEIKGRSLEKILEDRVAKESMSDLTTSPKWVLSGTPAELMRTIFQYICVTGTLNPADVIPFVVTGNLFPADTIAEPTAIITLELEPQTLSEVIENLATTYELGYRLVLEPDTSNLNFNVYSGVDRTSLQTIHPPLLFSPDLDNLDNTTEFSGNQNEKNVAYVFSAYGTDTVFADHVDPTIDGFDRRVLLVKADQITADTVDVAAALILAGKQALANAKRVNLFDGEISVGNALKYGTDYNIGDVVEIRNTDGVLAYKRVTEYIFTSDETGDHAYPTLSQGFDTNDETWESISELDIWDGYDLEVWDDFI